MYVQLVYSATYYTLSDVRTCMIIHVLKNNLPYHFLKQQFGKLRCDHLGDYWYILVQHETFNISLILLLSMVSVVDIAVISVESMIRGETHGRNVSLLKEDSHLFCSTCSRRNMKGDMATTTYLLTCRVGHEFDDDIHPLHVYGHVFDLMLLIHSSISDSVVDVIFVVQYLPCYFLQLQWMRCIVTL